MELHTAYICAGSNIGDRAENCRKGFSVLTNAEDAVLKAQSKFYKTEPVDYRDQDWFVNAVIEVETGLNPFGLLKRLKEIERETGRTEPSIRFGPRVLDLDIILFDDAVISDPGLEIPHPRMHKRCFVLRPLCDIAPDINHPVFGKDMRQLLDSVDDNDQKVLEY